MFCVSAQRISGYSKRMIPNNHGQASGSVKMNRETSGPCQESGNKVLGDGDKLKDSCGKHLDKNIGAVRARATIVKIGVAAVALSALFLFSILRLEREYEFQVEKIHRDLQGKFVHYVPEEGGWTKSIVRPCGPASIEYLKNNSGYLVVGYQLTEESSPESLNKYIHVLVAGEPIKSGSVIFFDDERIVFNTAPPETTTPYIVTHVFAKNGEVVYRGDNKKKARKRKA